MVRRVTVHMMRHEKTAGNIARQYVGQTDEPIVSSNRKPVTQQPIMVYGSTLQRCTQTAAIYFPQASYYAHAGLCELHFGDFEMKTYEQLQHIPQYRAWIDNPQRVTPPNGERFVDFTTRIEQALQEIITKADTYVFVVHGGVIRYMKERCGIDVFQQATATHQMMYTFTWETYEAFKEGQRCISYSEAPIMAKQPMRKQ